jgi:acyl-CoA thioesterase-2
MAVNPGTVDTGGIDFATLLELEDRGDGRYRGVCHEGAPMRAFGGHLAAQAFTAAASTVPAGQAPASMHAYFAKAAVPGQPIDYVVELTRDGGSLSTRSVTAHQLGQTVLVLMASFQRPEEGPKRQRRPEGSVVPPEEGDDRARAGQATVRERAVEQHEAAGPDRAGSDPGIGYYSRWMRACRPIGDNAALQAGAVVYMADMVLTGAALQPHRNQSEGAARATSLDHSLWFHSSIRAEQWLLLEAGSPVLEGSRGLAFAHIYSSSGALVATAAQEILARQLGAWQRITVIHRGSGL